MRKHIVVFTSSPKGGVGKSTIVWNLATMWSKKGYRVAILDLDRNQMCYRASGYRQIKEKFGQRDINRVKVHEPLPGTLSKAIQSLTKRFDLVIIDSAGFFDEATRTCLKYTDLILLPTLTNATDTIVMDLFWPSLMKAIKSEARSIPVYLVINGVPDMRNTAESFISQLKKLPDAIILRQVIHKRAIYEHCLLEGQSVDEIQGLHKDEKAVAEMQNVFNELNKLVGL